MNQRLFITPVAADELAASTGDIDRLRKFRGRLERMCAMLDEHGAELGADWLKTQARELAGMNMILRKLSRFART